ncbi:MAG: DciA family protein [Alphaproteobacteria bacterium]
MFIPRSISSAIEKIARQTIGKDWSLYAALLDHWQEIVGPDYSRVTTPVKVTFPHQPHEAQRKSGTLYIRLPKGLAMEFTFKTEQIRQRVNSYFGYEAISKIMLEGIYAQPPKMTSIPTPNPKALADISEAAKTIEDEELRHALETFGQAVLQHSEAKQLG